jgi:hypothetical protein
MSFSVFSPSDAAGAALSLALWPQATAPATGPWPDLVAPLGLPLPEQPLPEPALDWPLPLAGTDPYERLLASLAGHGGTADSIWFG